MIVYLAVLFSFVNREDDHNVCKSIQVEITDDSENHFILKEDIFNLLNDKGVDLVGLKMNEINREELETLLDHYHTIKKSEIYNNHQGIINIDITQRKPIVRVINQNEESYYIDEEGYLMPLSDNFIRNISFPPF